MDVITSNSSSDGVNSISVSFDSCTDNIINQVKVQNRVSLAETQLPEEVRNSGVKVKKASNLLLVYNFVNEDPFKTEYSVETISGYLDKNLTDNVKRVKGVGDFVSQLLLASEAGQWCQCPEPVIAGSGVVRRPVSGHPRSSPPWWCRCSTW